MKKFTINCDFGGQMSPFTIFIGEPESEHHPLHFQADWLSKERNGTIPSQVMDAIAKLKELADKNKVSLEELCVYALGSVGADETQSIEAEGDQANTEQEAVAPDAYEQQETSAENIQTQEAVDNVTGEELPSQEAADTVTGEELPNQGATDTVTSEEVPSQEAIDNTEVQTSDVENAQAVDDISVGEAVNDSIPADQVIDTGEAQINQQAQDAGDNISVPEDNLDNQVITQENTNSPVAEQVAVDDNVTEQQNVAQNVDEKPVNTINDQQVVSSDSENKQ